MEKAHGVNGYPAFVISRTRFPNYYGLYSDSVGKSQVINKSPTFNDLRSNKGKWK